MRHIWSNLQMSADEVYRKICRKGSEMELSNTP